MTADDGIFSEIESECNKMRVLPTFVTCLNGHVARVSDIAVFFKVIPLGLTYSYSNESLDNASTGLFLEELQE